jgi:hypothetical protein
VPLENEKSVKQKPYRRDLNAETPEYQRYYNLAFALRSHPRWMRSEILTLFLAEPCPHCDGPDVKHVDPKAVMMISDTFNEFDKKWSLWVD